jgi:uncharacterized SAM-binding protein YcdF (DUF218 family)
MYLNSKKINQIRMWLYLLGLYIFVISCSYSSKTCLKLLQESMHERYDVVIVPGVPLENEKWSPTMKERIYWSKYLYDKGIAKNVMYSGSAVYTPYIEGKVMALYAEALGIPKGNIYSETKAEHSTQNIYYSYHKAKKLGFKKIALASDPYQTKSLQKFTRKRVSRDVRFIPAVIDTVNKMEMDQVDPVIDYQQTRVQDFIPLPQRENFWKRLKGTAGLDIDTTVVE